MVYTRSHHKFIWSGISYQDDDEIYTTHVGHVKCSRNPRIYNVYTTGQEFYQNVFYRNALPSRHKYLRPSEGGALYTKLCWCSRGVKGLIMGSPWCREKSAARCLFSQQVGRNRQADTKCMPWCQTLFAGISTYSCYIYLHIFWRCVRNVISSFKLKSQSYSGMKLWYELCKTLRIMYFFV